MWRGRTAHANRSPADQSTDKSNCAREVAVDPSFTIKLGKGWKQSRAAEELRDPLSNRQRSFLDLAPLDREACLADEDQLAFLISLHFEAIEQLFRLAECSHGHEVPFAWPGV